jgi:hypothetical protein
MTVADEGSKRFTKAALIKGRPAEVQCVEILGQTFTISPGVATVMRLEDDWYNDVRDPEAVIEHLRGNSDVRPDIFTFWHRLSRDERDYPFYRETEPLAVLRIATFDEWWKSQIGKNTRNMVRKSEKSGIAVRECSYDDEFVTGMTAIFNEAPVRQGRPFWHYGKDVATVREQFSRHIDRERLIGAFLDGQMVGFAMLGNAGTFCDVGQIIAMMAHRDKAIPNALIAKAVQLCEQERWPSLVYAYWTEDSLASFKRHSGFEEVRVPRYFVPLTARGRLALRTGAHHGLKALIPPTVKSRLKQWRSTWYGAR